MNRKIVTALLTLIIFYISGAYIALAQQQQPPLVPPHIIYGTAKVDNVPLTRFNTQSVVSMRMEFLLILFYDSPDYQGDIVEITNELDAGTTTALRQAFEVSDYCSSRVPPIELSQNAFVLGEPNGQTNEEWRVRDGINTYKVVSEDVLIWNGGWVPGVKLQVFQQDGLIASYRMGDLQTDNYALEVPVSSNLVLWGNNSYILRDPGKAIAGEKARIFIDDAEVISPQMPYMIGQEAFVQRDLNAPSERDWIMSLPTGWTLVSFGIDKCFYHGDPPNDQPQCVKLVNVADLGFDSLAAWLSHVLTPNQGANSWQMVIGPNGAMDAALPPIFHTLKYFSPLYSYWISIDNNSGGAIWRLKGQYYNSQNCPIPLVENWNYVGYASMVGYYDTDTQPVVDVPNGTTWVKVPAPVATHVLGGITGKYSIVMSESGAYDPNLPPLLSSLHYFAPGHGFQIKMNQAEDLIYPSQ